MFRSKIILLNSKWEFIYRYKSRIKPNEGELIYVDSNIHKYFEVIKVIHSLKNEDRALVLIVKEWEEKIKK